MGSVILGVIQASRPACYPGVGMHADEFSSTALEEGSAALVHHKVVLADAVVVCAVTRMPTYCKVGVKLLKWLSRKQI